MKDPFEQLMKNIEGNASLRPRRRTVKLDETGTSGTANIPYEETEIKITVQDLKDQYLKTTNTKTGSQKNLYLS